MNKGVTGVKEAGGMDGRVVKAADSQSIVIMARFGSNPVDDRRKLTLRNHAMTLQKSRRRFPFERRGRAACFSRPQKKPPPLTPTVLGFLW
ncbi:hypothetical protein Y032_0464g1923 [Ancylostoma ceylanicum]|nr:hypothetical protein Y032_0464g1923 [Ancylostoma ceylanicum]